MSATADGLHSVIVEVGPYGATSFSFRCHADATKNPACHMVCEKPSCEEGCIDPTSHAFTNSGECMVCLWLDESDADECIAGRTTSVEVPIKYDWHGDGVDWAFEVTA